MKERKVFGHVLAAFRYGREDLDVLGLTFRKDLYLAAEQIFPQDGCSKRPLTRLQVIIFLQDINCLSFSYKLEYELLKNYTSCAYFLRNRAFIGRERCLHE